jgi:membrane-associated protein
VTEGSTVGAVLWAVGMVLLGYATASVPCVRDVALWAMAASIAATAAYVLAHVVRGRARRRSGV